MQQPKLRFEWNNRKAASNLRKHGVSFEEASSVFYDEYAQEFDDVDHSEEECRFLLLGLSKKRLRTLVVSFCYRAGESSIRIITARKADKHEASDYFKGRSI